MPICIIIALDIFITLRFSINCSIVIFSPTILFAFMIESSSETYGPGSSIIFYFWSTICNLYFPIYTPKIPKIFILLSLSDLTYVSDREGIDNPFITLGASVWLFVQVPRLGTCLYLLLDWYLGSLTEGETYLYFAASPFPLQGKNQRKLKK